MENKLIIYQVLPRWFGNPNKKLQKNGSISENGVGKLSAFTPRALQAIKELGVTHIWYTGIIEHATQTNYTSFGILKDHRAIVKGKAGSPYAIKDYYDIDPDLADHIPNRMQEFVELVKRTHDAGLKVIIDFVPNHVARQYHSDQKPALVQDFGTHDNTHKAFDTVNNFYYLPGHTLTLHFGAEEEDFEYSEFPAKATGNDCFTSNPSLNDWYETVKLNYGVDYANGSSYHFHPLPDTWKKMLDILLFWVKKGVDGFRCDMAEMVPVEFWNWVIPQVKAVADCSFIGEVYNPNLYRTFIQTGHFDYLYDKVGLYDTLRDVICGKASTAQITNCWQSVEGIQTQMVHFLENHDEQRIASDFFAGSGMSGYPGMLVAATMNTNPVLIYSGQEFGERGMDEEGFSGRDGRTTIFDYWSLSCLQNWMNDGAYDGGLLTEEQKKLRELYAQLLNLSRTERAIREGAFFDLSYANPDLYVDGNRQYAFLRSYGLEVILIVANFDANERGLRIHLPSDAFEALQIPDNQPAEMTDLLTGKQSISTLTFACPFEVRVPAHSGKILKFKYQQEAF